MNTWRPRIVRAHLPSRLRLSDAQRSTLAEIAKRLGRKALKDIARVAKPDTILAWYRRLVAQKFEGSRRRVYPGRPRVSPEIEVLVIRFARENRGWGYDRIMGALANLGHQVSDQTVGNILTLWKGIKAPRGHPGPWFAGWLPGGSSAVTRSRKQHPPRKRIFESSAYSI
jgi:putative transposase